MCDDYMGVVGGVEVEVGFVSVGMVSVLLV